MAEAGKGDLNPTAKGQIENILRTEEAKGFYARLNKSLGKIKEPKLEGVGTFIVTSPQLEDPLQESKIEIKIKHYKNNDKAFRTTIVLGNEGAVFYEREYAPGSGKEMITKGLSKDAEDVEAALKDIKEVVEMIENAASKSK